MTYEQTYLATTQERERRAEIMRVLRLARITVHEADVELRLAINEQRERERNTRGAWNGELG